MVTSERQGRCSLAVKADGTAASNPILYPSQTINVAYYRETLTVVRPFVFASLEVVGTEIPELLNSHPLMVP